MEAHTTLQTYLDEVGATVMNDDWDGYFARVCLPFHLVTQTASMIIATEDDLRAGFDTFVQTLRIRHVTDYIRLAEDSVQVDESLISGRYVSHIMAGSHRIVPPFRSQITLRRDNGIWRGTSITNTLANSRWPILLSSVSNPPLTKGPLL